MRLDRAVKDIEALEDRVRQISRDLTLYKGMFYGGGALLGAGIAFATWLAQRNLGEIVKILAAALENSTP